MFGSPAAAPGASVPAEDTNTTNRPSAVIFGLRLGRSACVPSVATLMRVV